MKTEWKKNCGCCGRFPRRTFLADFGMGFAGLALGSMFWRDGVARAAGEAHSAWTPPSGRPLFPPKAKSIIWIFLSGGYSHVETFDPKPALNEHAGKTFDKTPFENPANSPKHKARFRSVAADAINVRDVYPMIYPMQVGWKKYGQCGIEITDWWPHLARCSDDIAWVRNMWTTDNDHWAENQIHTGRHRLDETQPSLGAWVHYGLGSLNDNLPSFVTVGVPKAHTTSEIAQAYYLGPEHAGVPLAVDPKNPLPYGTRPEGVSAEAQANEFELIQKLNGLAAVEYPNDQRLRARIKGYELAFKMQAAVPDAMNFPAESENIRRLYGLDQEHTRVAGERLLCARRLAERGVRFVLVYPSGLSAWDSHQKLKDNHEKLCANVDLPVAGLLHDLKQRGLMEDVLVVFCTEFGRTPGLEQRSGGKDGRDHHPHGFTIWFAGAGIKGGTIHGATDELGYHALGEGHYVTDIHATVLHLLGLDPRKLEVPGRKRLEIDHGSPIREILA
ncbi:MAG: DUF1501 domain-containing protein [Verrucomicrobia bacterium]|nr:MAG: DUF1501 domain-containing protein [Verrucomicrobiota bacterium]